MNHESKFESVGLISICCNGIMFNTYYYYTNYMYLKNVSVHFLIKLSIFIFLFLQLPNLSHNIFPYINQFHYNVPIKRFSKNDGLTTLKGEFSFNCFLIFLTFCFTFSCLSIWLITHDLNEPRIQIRIRWFNFYLL